MADLFSVIIDVCTVSKLHTLYCLNIVRDSGYMSCSIIQINTLIFKQKLKTLDVIYEFCLTMSQGALQYISVFFLPKTI